MDSEVRGSFIRENWPALGLMAFYVLFQLLARSYGFHRDELYYLMMSRRLDLGYLDVPALAPLLLFLVRTALGTAPAAVHLLPALSGAALIFLTFRMARELGGGPVTAGLAACAAAFPPQFVGSDSIYSYDYLDKIFWVLALYFLLLYFKRGAEKYLYVFGLAAGFGLSSKVSIVFLGVAVVIALALTGYRRLFARGALYASGGVAFLFGLPYLVWQVVHHWPTLEFYGHYAAGKTYPYSLPGSFLTQVLNMNPAAFPLWAAGLVFFGVKDKGRFRPLTLIYAFLFFFLFAIQAKSYMIAPLYPILFAGGAVMLFGKGEASGHRWPGISYAAAVLVAGLVLSPLARPVLPVETLIRLTHGSPQFKQERLELGALPQHLADRFGWPELAAKCRDAYETLSPEEKKEAFFLTANYGEASAINFYGKAYGLPEAISGHNQYYLWGPRGHSGKVVIAFRVAPRDELLKYFDSVEEAGRTDARYAMPYEVGQPIYICRGIRVPLAEVWPKCKSYG